MTTDMMNFRDLVEKAPDADLLREMIGFSAERLMELEVGAVTGAAYGEKDTARQAQRSGCLYQYWETRAGAVEFRIPKLRKGCDFPHFLNPQRMAEKAPAAVIQEARVQGISTRSVAEFVKAMCMSGISKSKVSRLSHRPDRPCADVDAIARRHLSDVQRRIEPLEALCKQPKRMLRWCDRATVSDCRALEVLLDHGACFADHDTGA